MRRIVLWVAMTGALLASISGSAAEPSCNRQCLAGVLDVYLQAQLKHDPSLLPVTRNVKYTENGVRLALDCGRPPRRCPRTGST